MKVIHNIEPIYDENSNILILGSMPSVLSREEKFYYAHKQNRFWSVMETIFNVKLTSNDDKKNFLIQNHIAIWDVIASCDIKGSSDASIKNIQVNNIEKIINIAQIKCIFCTGKTSFNLFLKFFNFNIPVVCLPSPSSANASYNLDKLICEYKQILDYLPR